MSWSVSEAKAKLSEVLSRARKAPQQINSRGEPLAVVISQAEYDRLTELAQAKRPTAMQSWLEACEELRREGPLDLALPARKARDWGHRRDPFDEKS